jgi:uncharacterized protein YbjT (DUF2867 family)
MKALVIGGTGKVGRVIVSDLRAAGHDARSAARNGSDVTLDMRDAAAVEAAARGYDAAFFITPLGPDETEVGLAVHTALLAAGVQRIGYLAIHNLDALRAIPHFETKRPIRDAVLARAGGVVVAPNFFFQNDLLVLEPIKFAGVYPLPVGETGVYSVDVGDIGSAAARALLSSKWDGAMVPVCGAEKLTGPLLAADWSTALGKPVHYAGDDIAPLIAALSARIPNFGEWERNDFTMMMKVTQAMGCLATEADIALSRAVIGREPKTHLEFARKEAA